MISDKSLSCGAVVATRETSGCMRDSPFLRSSHNLYCMSSSSYWVVLQENVCHQPLNMCLNDISPVCLWECLFPRDDWIFVLMERDYQDVTDQIRGAKCLRIKLQRDKSWWATRFSFPPCVDDLLCPDSVVLTACLCSFCHTKATSSASAHNCLISTMQNWNYLLYCRWIWVFLDVYKLQSSFSLYSLIHTCKSWSHRYGYIYIILYFKIGAFYFRFCSSTKSDVCIPSYIWIYITIIYYLFSSLEVQRVFNL